MKLFYSLFAVAALLATSANAQVWPKPVTSGNFSVRSAPTITSATVITDAPVRDTSSAMDLLLTASTTTTITLVYKLDSGLIVSTSTVVANATPQTVHLNAPLNFQKVAVSPTTIGNATVSATLIQSK